MSNLKGSILKGGSGKLANIIQSSWKGIDYIRVKPDHVKNPRTPEQQSHRRKFKAVTNMAKLVLQPLIRPIWNPITNKHMGFNKFTQANIHAFKDDGSIEKYEDLKFSKGDLSIPEEIQINILADSRFRILVKWSYDPEKEENNGNDILNMVLIEETSNSYNIKILNNISIIREQVQAFIDLPFSGDNTIHIYPYFKNMDGTSYSHNSYAKVKPIQ